MLAGSKVSAGAEATTVSRQIFGSMNADFYDLVYSDKDYEAECDLLEEIFRRYGAGPVQNLLDLGGGTGGHALPLAWRGYRVPAWPRAAWNLTS